jgi:hypothetical protein
MFYQKPILQMFLLLLLCVLAAGCGPAAPVVDGPYAASESTPKTSPLAGPFPLPSPSVISELAATPLPSQLLVLHTNDNWGETEPCG